MSERTTSAAWVKGIADALNGAGLDAGALFAEAGIELAALSAPTARCATEKVSRLWDLAAERSGDRAIALRCAPAARPSKFEVVGYAMMSSPSLRAGLERLVRYLRILSDAAEIVLEDGKFGCRLELILFGGHAPVPGQRYEFDLLALLNFCRWIAGRELHPLQAEFADAAPADAARYRDAFRCPVQFGAPRNALLFAADDMSRPLPAADATLVELHDRFAGDRIRALDLARASVLARACIVRALPDGEPRREAIARAMCISERTLQRRLLEEGASFQQLLDDTRRELAERYLVQESLTFAQATYLLGFADQATFTRACKRWFALTPGQYRQRRGVPLS